MQLCTCYSQKFLPRSFYSPPSSPNLCNQSIISSDPLLKEPTLCHKIMLSKFIKNSSYLDLFRFLLLFSKLLIQSPDYSLLPPLGHLYLNFPYLLSHQYLQGLSYIWQIYLILILVRNCVYFPFSYSQFFYLFNFPFYPQSWKKKDSSILRLTSLLVLLVYSHIGSS